ncbi:hypothetical protein [uncultured Aquimarina sp.]|uniref:hypothetical protein n=1 Tax=uncultured Aquimarina sp. TaxID=575652 RepID=UPI0026026F3D|nr:hypothetical protein [uncultured Aquimarina sp.]
MYTEDHIQKIILRVRQLITNPFKQIEKKTDLSRTTINRFFSGVTVRQSTQDKIFKACVELIDEKQQEQLELKKRSEQLLQLRIPLKTSREKKIA